MAVILMDSFSDTNWDDLVGEHTPEIGGAYVQHPSDQGGGCRFFIFQNRTHCGVVGAIYNDVAPASADYDVECDYTVFSQTGSQAIAGRMDTSNATYYYTYYASSQAIVLVKNVAGTLTTIGSWGVFIPNGTTGKLRLSMAGTTIKVFWEGVERISVSDASIAGPGRAGVRSGSANDAGTEKHIDNLVVTDSAPNVQPTAQVLGIIGI